MIRLVLLSALVAVAFGAQIRQRVPMLDGRIVGGKDVDIEEFPHQISLLAYGSHSCGGSIIAPNKVLTAAHCTYGRAANNLKVRHSTSLRNQGGQVMNVKEICQHPEFDYWSINKDVSVLILEEDIELGTRAQSVQLIKEGEEIEEGVTATVTGWGALRESGGSPSQLQAVEVPHVSDERCKELYSSTEITSSMICFGVEKGGKDSCQGDSGGPLVSEGRQVGVVSWGYGCARPEQPGVYAKVSALRGHIDSC